MPDAIPPSKLEIARIKRFSGPDLSQDICDRLTRSRDIYDNLAEMLVGIHDRQRLSDVCELEGLVDRQGQLAGLDRRPQISAHQLDDLAHLLGRPGAEGHADIVDALERV